MANYDHELLQILRVFVCFQRHQPNPENAVELLGVFLRVVETCIKAKLRAR